MGLFRRRTGTSGLHKVVEEMGMEQVLAQSPASLLITDSEGTIVYRNAAALAVAAKVAGDLNDTVLDQLRQRLKAAIFEAPSFPYTNSFHVQVGERESWAEVTINKLDSGYLASWSEITAEHQRRLVLTETAHQLTSAVESFERLIAGLSRDTDEVSARAEAVASGTEELTASIRDISSSTSTAATNTGTAVQSAGTANERITELGQSSTQIGAVGELIKSIAEQTNLLALNATIEAARAGEAGKGFAVVAGEVKDLAQRTSDATGQIAHMIDAIQTDSVGAAGSIEEIVRLIGQIEGEQSSIAGAVEEQSATASEISASVSAVAQAAHSSASAVEDLKTAVSLLSEKARRLRELV
ncbi:methyl-accepting chemotaxis protein [Actinoplanes sp. NPDC051475]|uniref:methyl-accepting chemotaxis protein n=1 Tax=Actinoplanes sp. NPDC051475 TaxID=3157225 RepID=UPI00344BDF4F